MKTGNKVSSLFALQPDESLLQPDQDLQDHLAPDCPVTVAYSWVCGTGIRAELRCHAKLRQLGIGVARVVVGAVFGVGFLVLSNCESVILLVTRLE